MCSNHTTPAREVIRPADPLRQETRLYLLHSDRLLARFDSFKSQDRFYFIELGLDMTYFGPGFAARLANPPYHLGTILRCVLEHHDLFGGTCPRCGKALSSHAFNGSPLSGRVDLSLHCPDCVWEGYIPVSGWKRRSEALRKVQREDRRRLVAARLLHPGFKAAGMEELLDALGIPLDAWSLPQETPRRERFSEGVTLTFYPDGSIIKENFK